VLLFFFLATIHPCQAITHRQTSKGYIMSKLTNTTNEFETQSYTVGDQFLMLISCGETDGMTKNEIKEFDDFEKYIMSTGGITGYEFQHWSITNEKEEFSECEISDFYGNCTKIDAVYKLIK
jgi:hypothetical protein